MIELCVLEFRKVVTSSGEIYVPINQLTGLICSTHNKGHLLENDIFHLKASDLEFLTEKGYKVIK